MKQPSVYSLEQIVEAAFTIIQEEGREKVTARAIAKVLGSSTMPIYSRMKSVDDLDLELKKRGRRQLVEYQRKSYTDDLLLNLAVGYIAFARDQKNVFRYLFLEKTETMQDGSMNGMRETFVEDFGEDSQELEALAGITPEQQEALMKHTWIFTHGLAMLAYAGNMDREGDEAITGFLQNAGAAFYLFFTGPGFGAWKEDNQDSSGKNQERKNMEGESHDA